MAKIDEVFEGKLSLAQSSVLPGNMRPAIAEHNIIWDKDGIRAIIAELQHEVYDLRTLLSEIQNRSLRQDFIAAPDVDASTFYEIASDGALRAGVDVVVEGNGLVEVAMLEAPTILYASADATVYEANPTTNYNTLMRAGLDASGKEYRALLAFPWGTYNPGSSITGLWAANPILALVRLHKDGVENDDLDFRIYPMVKNASWSETAVTWNTKPANENDALDLRANDPAAPYTYLDITPYIRRAREMRDGSWAGSPPGFTIVATGPNLVNGNSVTWNHRGNATNDYKPQLWYWEKAYKAQILGSAVKEAKFYGKAGETYYITYRYIDANNHPGKWAIPVKVTLPSQGNTPAAPNTPVLEDTSIRNMKVIYIGGAVPADFDHYEIDIYNYTISNHTYIRSRSDRFLYTFLRKSPYAGDQTYRISARIVTRSGKVSAWSDYTTFLVTGGTKIYCEDGPGQSYGGVVEIEAAGYITTHHPQYNYLREEIGGVYYRVLKNAAKDVTPFNIEDLYGNGKVETGTWSTANSDYTYLTDVAYTPPGSGTARCLFLAVLGVSGIGGRYALKVDGNTLISEYGDDSGAYSTLTLAYVASVSAGSSHNFQVYFRTVNQTTTVYRRALLVIDLGRV